MKQRVYIDTSVIGGCFDVEFEKASNELFNEFLIGNKIAIISDLTIDEIQDAPKRVIDKSEQLIKSSSELVASNNDSKSLAEKYILEKAISKKYYEDAQHIALATVYKVDVLVSWNFKHIVNLERIKMYNSVNLKNGYQVLEIRTPREIIKEV